MLNFTLFTFIKKQCLQINSYSGKFRESVMLFCVESLMSFEIKIKEEKKLLVSRLKVLCHEIFDLRFFSFFQQEDFEILGSNVLEIYSMVQCSTPHTVIQRGA